MKRGRAGLLHLAAALLPLLAVAACASGPPPASHDEIVRRELAGIITAKGVPCGKVLDYAFDDRLDYRVFCASGLVVRIQVTAEGQVEATHPAGSR